MERKRRQLAVLVIVVGSLLSGGCLPDDAILIGVANFSTQLVIQSLGAMM